ncbi:NUDIX domain-containing protein, partial [Brevibacterium paucivorans]
MRQRPLWHSITGTEPTPIHRVRAGETLEQAVRREVHEESDIDCDTIRYLGSQPWPFPCSLMLGFAARAQ